MAWSRNRMMGSNFKISKMKKERHESGFTLVEILAVIAVVAILVALLTPVVANARRQAENAKCISNLHQIHMMMSLYAGEHNGWFPPGEYTRESPMSPYNDFSELLEYGAAIDDDIWECPSAVQKKDYTAKSAYYTQGGNWYTDGIAEPKHRRVTDDPSLVLVRDTFGNLTEHAPPVTRPNSSSLLSGKINIVRIDGAVVQATFDWEDGSSYKNAWLNGPVR